MAVETTSSTGSNTSGNSQAVIKVAEGVPEELKAILESLVIEFPDALSSSGGIDVLSSTAVNQITTQLVASTEFQNLLQTTITTDPTITSIVTAVTGSTTFTDAIDSAIDTKLADSATITTLGQALISDATFQQAAIDALLSSADFTNAVQASVESYLQSLNLTSCATQTYTVVTGNVIEVPIQNQVDNDYWFDYQVIAYDNVGGGSSSDGSFIRLGGRTPSTVTIVFPNALPGDTVTLYHLTQSCRI